MATKKAKTKSKRKAKKKGVRRKASVRKKKTRARRGRVGLSALSLAQLHAEIRRREGRRAGLQRKRQRLVEQLTELDRQIAAYGPQAARAATTSRQPRRGRPRRRNTMNLVGALQRVLDTNTLSVTDAAEAVKRIGYHTRSANFRTIVNQALLANRKTFKKVSRGMYTAKR